MGDKEVHLIEVGPAHTAGDVLVSGDAVDKRIENIFVITKLSLVFDVFPNEEQAIASFAESRPV